MSLLKMQQNAMNVADRIFVHPIFSTSILSFRLPPSFRERTEIRYLTSCGIYRNAIFTHKHSLASLEVLHKKRLK
jgi:hypothetical protein